MSDGTVTLTPSNLRTLSVPGTPGSVPAAPFKRHDRIHSHPASDEGSSADSASEGAEPRNLSSAFDAVVTKSEPTLETAASVISPVDYRDVVDQNQGHSLSLPLSQGPVKPDALPQATVPERENALKSPNDQSGTPPADDALNGIAKPVSSTSVEADQAEVCPPSPPQTRPDKDEGLPVDTVLGPKGASFPHDEAERLRTVALLGILDQPEDPVLASITKLVTRLLKVSTAGINIIDKDRLWWPSLCTTGLPAYGWTHPREIGFCSYTLLSEAAEVLVVEDAQKDHRFKDSPFVTGFPNIRFYGGAPLIASNGHRIGALCAIDQQPRSLSSQQLAVLAHLAEMVVRRIERDKQILLQQHSKTALLRTLRNQQEAVLLCDTAMNGWPILFTNKSCHDMLGWDEDTLGGRGVWDMFKMEPGSKESCEKALAQRTRFTIKASSTKIPTHARQLQLEFRPANTPTAIHPSLQIGIPAFINDRDDLFQLYFVTIAPVPQILTAPGKLQAEMRQQSAGVSVLRPSDAWALNKTAPAYNSFPSDIRHTRTQQNLVNNNCELPSLQQSQFEEVQLGMLLGGSSSGNVYRGMWRSIPVAVKKTRARLVDCVPMGEKDALITQEAAAAMGVSHPHLVTTYKYAIKYHEKGQPHERLEMHDDGKPLLPGTAECWLFMEMCNKGTLQHAVDNGWFLNNDGKPKLVAMLSSAHEASLGVAQLHREHIIHGGICPAACFLKAARNQRGFVVKVGDLGHSSIRGKGTRVEVRRGLRFQSPEAICTGFTTKEGDAYAFGVMLYELYTGKPAWAGLSTGDIISAKLRSHAGTSLQLSPEAPPALQDLIDRCLSSNPSMRPSLDAIQDALLAIRDGMASPTHTSPQQQAPPLPPQTPSPFALPQAVPPSSSETRQAVTRSRINATQYQQPVRRQTLAGLQQPATRQPLIRQASSPQGGPNPADRIPAEWGRIARLESKKSAPIRTIVAAPATAPVTAPTAVPVTQDEITPAASLPDVVSEQTLPPARANSAPARKDGNDRSPCLQQIWRTMAFCSTHKTHSFLPQAEGSGHAMQSEMQSDSTAAEQNPDLPDGLPTGGRQANAKRSQRVKEMFSDRSKQIRQCVACK